ncbi:CoA ester lyase [Streptomyces sp. NPDC049097]|uniref:HpcH/HpaI aldolase/citrate lyase family protein n=1 Tax=Streptomyces sp. NPDC049097 TaxID=3155497 RepID=UPI00341E7358
MSALPHSTTSALERGVLSRSWLFVPGDRPERFAKALNSDADAVIVDLEDAVAPQHKTAARDNVVELAASSAIFVRVNGADAPWYKDDLAALRDCRPPLGVILPKTGSADDVAAAAALLGPQIPIVALVETASGVQNAGEIAAAESSVRLAFGNLDFGLDIDAETDDTTLLYARSALVIASRAAGLPGPVDGVTTELDDPAAAGRDAGRARRLGFAGKMCIHPRQTTPVNEAFGYSPETVAWARRAVEAAGQADGAAVRVDGEMIDKPRLQLAERVLAFSAEGDEP